MPSLQCWDLCRRGMSDRDNRSQSEQPYALAQVLSSLSMLTTPSYRVIDAGDKHCLFRLFCGQQLDRNSRCRRLNNLVQEPPAHYFIPGIKPFHFRSTSVNVLLLLTGSRIGSHPGFRTIPGSQDTGFFRSGLIVVAILDVCLM